MKRVFAITVLVCCAAMGVAQNFERGAALLMGQRWPTYYYWGDNWFDKQYDPAHSGCIGEPGLLLNCKPETARYIYSDSCLHVIGIAVAYDFKYYTFNTYHTIDTAELLKGYQTDWFRLYEVDSTTNEMILIAEKPLTDFTPACYLPTNDLKPMFGAYPSRGIPVREVYFDSAITVYDSFYVAVTCNNNYRRSGYVEQYLKTKIGTLAQRDSKGQPLCMPEPNHYRRKLHLVDSWDYDMQYGTTDTNWHVFDKMHYNVDPGEDTIDWCVFMMMFPIIDTTINHTWLPECKRPVDFSTIHVGREVVVLGWESEGSSQWELKVAKEGDDLDSVAPIACQSDVTPVYGLDTASWYVATVRSVCGENRISQWSDTLRFFVPGDTTSDDPTESIETMAERHTYLMPNPAGEQVTVMSSFRIDRVEIYTLTGQRILQQQVGGLSAQIDISDLSKGTYLVRTYTNHGVSNKRLVKN